MYSFIEVGLPLRGGLVYDELETLDLSMVDSNIILGKGLVKAYEFEGKQQIANCIVDKNLIQKFIELSEKALIVEPTSMTLPMLLNVGLLIKYDVPCSNGYEEHLVLKWPTLVDNHKPNFAFLERAFTAHNKNIDDPYAYNKLWNTYKFVEFAWKDKETK